MRIVSLISIFLAFTPGCGGEGNGGNGKGGKKEDGKVSGEKPKPKEDEGDGPSITGGSGKKVPAGYPSTITADGKTMEVAYTHLVVYGYGKELFSGQLKAEGEGGRKIPGFLCDWKLDASKIKKYSDLQGKSWSLAKNPKVYIHPSSQIYKPVVATIRIDKVTETSVEGTLSGTFKAGKKTTEIDIKFKAFLGPWQVR